jgi:hypothetical protein
LGDDHGVIGFEPQAIVLDGRREQPGKIASDLGLRCSLQCDQLELAPAG